MKSQTAGRWELEPRSARFRPVRRGRAAPRRSWRRRGRKAQASAVATILGLLLIVTFIANYLTTTLPQYMSLNDVTHDVVVENEVGRLAALLRAASAGHAIDAELSQPLVLGSAGLPPFAGPDGGAVGPSAGGVQESVKFAVSGGFNPPSAGKVNTGFYTKATCSISPAGSKKPTGVTCTGGGNVIWNFSAGNAVHYSISGSGGMTASLNFSTNRSIVAIAGLGGATDRVYVDGANDTVYVNTTGGVTQKVLIVGNYDTLNLGSSGGGTFRVEVVGSHDTVAASTTGGVTVHLVAYGAHDSFSESEVGGGTYNVFYSGFQLGTPQASKCPVANRALSDTVAGSPGGTVTYNDTTYTNSGHTGNASGWTYDYLNPVAADCPYVASGVIATTTVGAGIVVQLKNTYDPIAQVAFDSGAVVFAQESGIPVMFDPPPITLKGGGATIWVPVFTSTIKSEGGTGTAILEAQLTSVSTEVFPGGGYSMASSSVTVTIVTPYASAWMAYFASTSAFAGDATCLPAGATVCSPTGTFSFYGPLGTVTLTLPASSVTLTVATFSIGLT